MYVDSYPRSSYLEFHINIVYGYTISRLDFLEVDRHHNHKVKRVSTPYGIMLGWIFGSHFHRWADNSVLAGVHAGPKELEFAVPLPGNVRSFESAFRFFCADSKILVAANEMPTLPPRDTLL